MTKINGKYYELNRNIMKNNTSAIIMPFTFILFCLNRNVFEIISESAVCVFEPKPFQIFLTVKI